MTLAVLVAVLPSGLRGQAGVEVTYGSRSYHSGPTLRTGSRPTYEPAGVREVGLTLHSLKLGPARLLVGVNAFDAGFGLDGPDQQFSLKHKVAGYGARLGAELPIISLAHDANLGLRAAGGIEIFSLEDSPETTRAVFVGGPVLNLPLTSRLRIDLLLLVGTTSSSPYTQNSLPEEVENGVPWWTSFQVGVRWNFHSY